MFALLVLFAMTARAQEDRSHWVDPNDMLNFDLSTGEMKKKPTTERVNEVCNVCVYPNWTKGIKVGLSGAFQCIVIIHMSNSQKVVPEM